MAIEVVQGKGVDIHLWCPKNEIESQALDQLGRIASLPWAVHVAVMPDVHFGKGATVGSVIGLKQAVSPAAVGVDIGCVDCETEYLSPTGWKRIDSYNPSDPVMQYAPEDGTAMFTMPTAYIKLPCAEFWRIKTKYGVDQKLSDEHTVLYARYDRAYRFDKTQTITAEDLADWHDGAANGFRGRFITTFVPMLASSVDMTDEQLRVAVMVAADGSIRSDRTGNCTLHLKKPRKIERARRLLEAAGIGFQERSDSDETVTFSFTAPEVPGGNRKTLAAFWGASIEQLRVLAAEVFRWDGNIEDSVFYSRDKASADFVSYAFAATGSRSVMREDERDGGIDYRVFAHENTRVGINGSPKTPIVREPGTDGFKYCFTVPSGFWIMRRGGAIAMTGNCGMGAIKTNLDARKVDRKLAQLRSHIEELIPVGFETHRNADALELDAVREDAKALFDEFENLDFWVRSDKRRAMEQCGTLGGGNHFIELCLDTENNVWMMLHSGSRYIGKSLAEVHIARAKELTHNATLPDPDLAVFLAGTPEMEAYRRDLYWAQRYAFLNRRVMFELYKMALRGFWPGVQFEAPILCHHNYVAEEVHFGEQLFVTRKGAISAREGEMGIIPGSMGTKSYIVRGRGNKEALESASHGAGRKMSRTAAKKKFTIQDLRAQTDGVECRKDRDVIDEIPGAYKKIEKVMEHQRDLVEVVAELKQIVCIKG